MDQKQHGEWVQVEFLDIKCPKNPSKTSDLRAQILAHFEFGQHQGPPKGVLRVVTPRVRWSVMANRAVRPSDSKGRAGLGSGGAEWRSDVW